MQRFKLKSVIYSILNILMVIIILVITFRAKPIKCTYTEYTVQPGDTLWSISSSCNLPQDIRKTVYEIRDKNQLETAIIQPGQTLLIPEGVKE